jgi:hypothetical protein
MILITLASIRSILDFSLQTNQNHTGFVIRCYSQMDEPQLQSLDESNHQLAHTKSMQMIIQSNIKLN